jgi:hypothetical protein
MRTTLTLDDELARELKRIAHRTETPFKDVVDRVLRAGIAMLDRTPRRRPPPARTFKMGVPVGVDLDKALRLSSQLEDEEIVRKIALRK